MNVQQLIPELWQDRPRGLMRQLLQLLLRLPALIYGGVTLLRSASYRIGLLPSHRLPRPVLSVGNLAVGGTGKTPLTAWLARYLQQQGLRVAVLSRGYGGSLEGTTAVVSDGKTVLLTPDQCGDEPYLLASTIPGLMVVIGADRYRAGQLAMQQLQPDIFLLDDGYQHLRLHRDLNLLLLDCSRPFGNGLLLPAGPLREPVSAQQRADLLIFTRCSQQASQPFVPTLPTCRTSHQLTSFHRLADGEEMPLTTLQAARVAAFAGIASPEGFFTSLRQCGIDPVATLAFTDHQAYTVAVAEQLEQLGNQSGTDWLLTTEKDGVKLMSGNTSLTSKIVVARMEFQFDDAAPLEDALQATFKTVFGVV